MTDEPIGAEERMSREQAAEYAVEEVRDSATGSAPSADTVKEQLADKLDEAQAPVSDEYASGVAEKIASGDPQAGQDIKSEVQHDS